MKMLHEFFCLLKFCDCSAELTNATISFYVSAQMEVKKEFRLERFGSFEAAPCTLTGKDAIVVPQRKFGSKVSSIAQDNQDEDGISLRKIKSLDKKLESPAGIEIRKTKSLSAQFLINIDELINNDAGSYDQTGSIRSRASSNGIGYSFSLAGAILPSEDISDVLRIQIPSYSKKLVHNYIFRLDFVH